MVSILDIFFNQLMKKGGISSDIHPFSYSRMLDAFMTKFSIDGNFTSLKLEITDFCHLTEELFHWDGRNKMGIEEDRIRIEDKKWEEN